MSEQVDHMHVVGHTGGVEAAYEWYRARTTPCSCPVRCVVDLYGTRTLQAEIAVF